MSNYRWAVSNVFQKPFNICLFKFSKMSFKIEIKVKVIVYLCWLFLQFGRYNNQTLDFSADKMFSVQRNIQTLAKFRGQSIYGRYRKKLSTRQISKSRQRSCLVSTFLQFFAIFTKSRNFFKNKKFRAQKFPSLGNLTIFCVDFF